MCVGVTNRVVVALDGVGLGGNSGERSRGRYGESVGEERKTRMVGLGYNGR